MSARDLQPAPDTNPPDGDAPPGLRRGQPGAGVVGGGQIPRELAEPHLVAWPRYLGAIIGCALLAIAATMLSDRPGWTIGVAMAGVVVIAAVGWVGFRTNQRRRLLADLSNQISTQLRAIIRIERARKWTSAGPGHLVITYSPAAAAIYSTMLATQLCATVGKLTDRPRQVARHTPRRRRLVLTAAAEKRTAERTALEENMARVTDIAVETFGAGSKVSDIVSDGERVTGFTIHYTSGPKMTVESIRARMTRALTDRMAGRWKTRVDLSNDRLTVTLTQPLPKKIDRPTAPVEVKQKLLIPLGVDEDSDVVWWDVSGVMAHQLIAGRTRTGKTVSLIGTTMEAARRGWQIFIIDPKRIEFLGMRTWPNVTMVATKVEDQIAVLAHIHALMMERYRLVEEEGVDEASFQRVLLVVDEFRILYGQIQEWWGTTKISGMPAKCPAQEYLGALLRMAAAARIHVVLGMQRPDADILGGEERDNFALKAATGRLSPDGAQMMFENSRTGTTVPRSIQGRGAAVSGDDNPREIQYYYTPDPRKATSPDELELLAALRPSVTTWERVMAFYPSQEDAEDLARDSAAKTSVDWVKVCNARFIPWDPNISEAAVPVAEETVPEPGDGYGPAAYIAVGQIQIGDLAGLDEDDYLVTITGIEHNDSEDDVVLFTWRDDDDRIGEHEISADDTLNVRKPVNEEPPPSKRKGKRR